MKIVKYNLLIFSFNPSHSPLSPPNNNPVFSSNTNTNEEKRLKEEIEKLNKNFICKYLLKKYLFKIFRIK